MSDEHAGSLACVGLGIRAIAETSNETFSIISGADQVFSVANDAVSLSWLYLQNARTESLATLYAVGKLRTVTYGEMVDRIVAATTSGLRVCAVAYGHPGVFAFPFHEAIRQVRAAGLRAVMHPAVSAEDCLIADLGIDPGECGCHSFEATDFVVYRRIFDVRSRVILWQIGSVGELHFRSAPGLWSPTGLETLRDVLLEHYDANHEVVVYEASRHPLFASRIQRTALGRLTEAAVTALSTLYIPPAKPSRPDPAMLARLNLRNKLRPLGAA